ncbi:MAG: hypothetical protein KDK36_05350, partial [Leptospiraceae bacterium]|nr:hypothetical protein [Leptospiraceae bacterium]
MDKKIILNKTVIIFLFFFLFCSKVGKNKETFSIALPSEPTTIDPLYATDLMSRKLNLILFSKLLVKDSDLGFKNDIIEYYKID